MVVPLIPSKTWLTQLKSGGAPFFGAARRINYYHHCAPPLLKSFRRLCLGVHIKQWDFLTTRAMPQPRHWPMSHRIIKELNYSAFMVVGMIVDGTLFLRPNRFTIWVRRHLLSSLSLEDDGDVGLLLVLGYIDTVRAGADAPDNQRVCFISTPHYHRWAVTQTHFADALYKDGLRTGCMNVS